MRAPSRGTAELSDVTIAGLLRVATRRLRPLGDAARDDALELLRALADVDRAEAYAHPHREIEPTLACEFLAAVERRRAGEPAAYITGRRGFHAIDLNVDRNVLVPRPESELIVDEVLALAPPAASFSVLDLGTGSGALALAIAVARRDAQVLAVDISTEALALARHNARALGVQVSFVESDWLAALDGTLYDFIVCNPPYVRSDDAHLHALRYEPRLALDGGPDGLTAIRTVVQDAPTRLAPQGLLLLEHGYDQAASIAEIARERGLLVERELRDLGGLERVAVMSRK